MGVPEDIRKVERPRNTVVVDNGVDGPLRYAVRSRAGTKYVPGGNPQPINGEVIGHIIDGKFVPIPEEPADDKPDMMSYGMAALLKTEWQDVLDDLYICYDADMAQQVLAVSALKVLKPNITESRMRSRYASTFLSVFLPGLHLSKNTVKDLYEALGMNGAARRRFYRTRMERVAADHHIIIDGMLKQDNSTVNDLSDFSYKSRVKGVKDISVVFAYDYEAMELVCGQVFPGNCIDASAYLDFIRDNDVRSGIIVADKGFPPSKIKPELKNRPGLGFLTPLKRNDVRIAKLSMLEFEGVLKTAKNPVMYKKAATPEGTWLYSFKDPYLAADEDRKYLANRAKKGDFDFANYSKKDEKFGVVVFESSLDLGVEAVYATYEIRWTLELVNRRYKSDLDLDSTNVQSDFSVIGAEFVNFISSQLTCRTLKRFRDAELLDKVSYGDLVDDLNSCWRMADAPERPSRTDGRWVHTYNAGHELMEALGLSDPPAKPEPKKRGRPRKNPQEEKPKRPRGRPRKNQALARYSTALWELVIGSS